MWIMQCSHIDIIFVKLLRPRVKTHHSRTAVRISRYIKRVIIYIARAKLLNPRRGKYFLGSVAKGSRARRRGRHRRGRGGGFRRRRGGGWRGLCRACAAGAQTQQHRGSQKHGNISFSFHNTSPFTFNVLCHTLFTGQRGQNALSAPMLALMQIVRS